MHAFVVGIFKRKEPEYINNLMEDLNGYEESLYFDWYALGGRYRNLLPVGRRVKEHTPFEYHLFRIDNLEVGDCPHVNFEPGENIKYITGARIRNLNREEIERLRMADRLHPLNPYAFVLDQDGVLDWYTNETPEAQRILERYVNSPNHSGYWVVCIDIHF